MQSKLPEELDLIVYHADCADGFGAAWALHQKYGDQVDYVPMHYGAGVDLDMFRDRRVLMVDVSVSREDFQEIQSVATSFLLVDHHKTALENLTGLPGCIMDMDRSGAGLAWDLAHPGKPRPPLIDLVETRDLWKWDRDPEAKLLVRVLDTQGYTFHAWGEFNHRLETPGLKAQVMIEARAMDRLYQSQVSALAQDAQPIMLDGRCGHIACVPHIFASDVGARINQENPGDFALTWCATSDGSKARLSFRSAHDAAPIIDLARQFGGGGHPHASGASMAFGEWTQKMQGLLVDASTMAQNRQRSGPKR